MEPTPDAAACRHWECWETDTEIWSTQELAQVSAGLLQSQLLCDMNAAQKPYSTPKHQPVFGGTNASYLLGFNGLMPPHGSA